MKITLLRPLALGLALALCFTSQTTTATQINISRYLSVPLKPKRAQQHLLEQTIQVSFPQNILNTQQALNFILRFSGYRLANTNFQSRQAQTMLKQQLPEINQHLGPVTLYQGLTTLSGSAFTLLVDPVHRLIGFRLKDRYHTLFYKFIKTTKHKLRTKK